ncbi:MAG: DUF2167 domain-containing protein, partial [Blastocatellia bacterium]
MVWPLCRIARYHNPSPRDSSNIASEAPPFVEFNEGHRYGDYVAGVDKVAAYGIGGLIAGKLAAKAGLFKLLLA